MTPKKNRTDKKAVEKVFKEGKFINSPNLTFKFILPSTPSLIKEGGSLIYQQISFIVPKSVAKLAVKRNLLRRRGYSALEKHIKQFPSNIIGVFIFKKIISSVLEIENEIETILRKIH